MTIFSHVALGTNDLAKAEKFYDAILAPLGIVQKGAYGDSGTMWGAEGVDDGKNGIELIITRPGDGKPATHANGGTIAFLAPDRAAVRAFYEAALAKGGTQEFAPGPRGFTPTAYAAYVRDPDGNKLTAYSFKDEQ